jgi:hypothetical protein
VLPEVLLAHPFYRPRDCLTAPVAECCGLALLLLWLRPFLKMDSIKGGSMKVILFLMAILFMSELRLISSAQAADPALGAIEVPVEALLTPSLGFEEKNTIQVVLYGVLPNTCYTLADTTTEKVADHVIRVRQFALHDTSGVCADESSLPIHMKMIVPFTQEVSVGLLPAGDYRFVYNKRGDAGSFRAMHVSKNVTPTTDTLPYAAVSEIQARDIVSSRDHLVVTIGGVLNSTCTSLDREIRLLPEDDVMVILPTIKVREGVICTQMLVPFQRRIDLGPLPPGVRLIHVRSMNGKAVNKVVNVVR